MKIVKIAQSSGVVATVVDNLTSDSVTDALSANQGKVLNEKVSVKFLEDGVDLNTIVTEGIYRSIATVNTSTMLNVPSWQTSGFALYVYEDAGMDGRTNIRQKMVRDSRTYTRFTNDAGKTWSEWSIMHTYDIGDICITSTNVNPASRLGGTWLLIDKEFLPLGKTLEQGTDYTINTTNCKPESSITMLRSGHSINLRVAIHNAVEIGDSTLELLTLNYSSLGISDTGYTHGNITGFSDGGQGVVSFSLSYDTGVLQTNDAIVKSTVTSGTIPANTTMYLNFTMPILRTDMLDEACGKFYWKRIT